MAILSQNIPLRLTNKPKMHREKISFIGNCFYLLYCIVLYFFYHYFPPYPPLPLPAPFPLAITTVLYLSSFSFISFFAQFLHPPMTCILSCQLFSMSLSLFCLSVQFVHYILHMSEIIWYLSFSGLFHFA